MAAVRTLAIGFAFLAASAAAAVADDKPVEIPLKAVWAYHMPDARDMTEVGDRHVEDSLIRPLLRHFRETWNHEHGWAVEGEGLRALENLYRRNETADGKSIEGSGDFAKDNDRIEVPAERPLSLAFFTRLSDVQVQLYSIERTNSRIHIRYFFAPSNRSASQQLALIPVGKLAAGSYWATIERVPTAKKFLDAGFVEPPHEKTGDVCGSFGFRVVDAAVAAAAAKPRTIPLNDVWALKMPDTRDIKELDGGKAYRGVIVPLLRHIRETWNNDHGAAVQGEGFDALEQFNRIEVEGKKPEPLSADKPISAVFFTRLSGFYVHLQAIEKHDHRITIRYELVPHVSREATQHLALIPLGTVAAGKYVVSVEQLPLAQKYRNQGVPEPSPDQKNRVCGSFEFLVIDRR